MCYTSPVAHSQSSRDLICEFINNAAEPVTVEQIIEHTSLKSNTVRGHLDILMATGAVSRTLAESVGRGRPRWLYSCATPEISPYQVLAQALSVQLDAAASPEITNAAAERWAHTLPALEKAQSPDLAVEQATNALNDLGFSAKATDLGDAIAISQCPYADLVSEYPIICDIHAALLDKLFTQTGQDVSVASLDVWARKDLCVARLNRPDLQAERTISISPQRLFQVIEEREGNAS